MKSDDMKKFERTVGVGRRPAASLLMPLLLVALLHAHTRGHTPAPTPAQKQSGGAVAAAGARKPPPPEKIVGDYVKAVGGKKLLAQLRDATYEWSVVGTQADSAQARTHLKSPASARTDINVGGVETNAAASPASAWARGADGLLRTLTDREAYAAKLRAALDATRLLDFKKQKILARTAGLEQVAGERAYVVEFSTRAGARLRYYFGADTHLLLKTVDDAGGLTQTFSDYRADAEGRPLEPHRVVVEREGAPALTLALREARYNTNLPETLFDAPGDPGLSVPALLRELARNQDEDDKRIDDYTFTLKETERKLNDRGEVTKEEVNVYEVYPVANYGWVMKQTVEKGVPLSAERAAKEEKRVAEELQKAEREAPKNVEKRARRKAEREAKRRRQGADSPKADDEEDEGDVDISTFLRASEFVSPRRERFRERDAIVFDFRPRPGFKPSNQGETIASKLVGTVWVDPVDRQVMRLEGRLTDSFKMAGGLALSVKPGAAFVFEQTRLPEGVWLPRFSQVNASAKVFLFAGITVNETNEFSDYKRFSTKAGDATLNTPEAPQKKP
jgi:hypothetical protein